MWRCCSERSSRTGPGGSGTGRPCRSSLATSSPCSAEASKLVVAADDFGFQIAPESVELSGDGAGLVDVLDAVAVQFVFEFSAEAGALQAFGEEIALKLIVLEVFADVGEAFLTVLEHVDDFLEYGFDFLERVRLVRHAWLVLFW